MAIMDRYAIPVRLPGAPPATMVKAHNPNTVLDDTRGFIDEYRPAKGGYYRDANPGVQYVGACRQRRNPHGNSVQMARS